MRRSLMIFQIQQEHQKNEIAYINLKKSEEEQYKHHEFVIPRLNPLPDGIQK